MPKLTSQPQPLARCRAGRAAPQQGVVLIIALVVLVAMTLAALALVRSVDTNNMIAGNLAFQQSATQSGDIGIEDAASWLQTQSALIASGNGNAVNLNQSTGYYRADGSVQGPDLASHETWEHYWNNTLLPNGLVHPLIQNQAGNTVSYVIDRLCASPGAPDAANCAASQIVGTVTGNSQDIAARNVNVASSVYYRITVRVDGPRNTVSFVQAVIAM